MPVHPTFIPIPIPVDDCLVDEEFDIFDIAPSQNVPPDMERLALVCDNVIWDKSNDDGDDMELL